MNNIQSPAGTTIPAARQRTLTPQEILLGAATLAMLAGALVLIGWFADIALLKSLRTGWPA